MGYLLDEFGLVDVVGYLGDDNLIVCAFCLYLCFGAHDDAATACLVGFAYSINAADDASCGEVWTFDVVHEFIAGDVWVVYIGYAAVDDFAEVVGGDVGGHADGDACGSVDEEVGDACGQDGWFFLGVVEVVYHVDSVFVYVEEHGFAEFAEAGFGVSHGGCTVAIDRAEVALAVDEGVAHGPWLGEANEGSVY